LSFSCPYFQFKDDFCYRLNVVCVPGRPGCVLQKNSKFVVPVEERLRERQQERKRADEPGNNGRA
jgi:hypothetical protein